MIRCQVACLDVWAQNVREIVAAEAPAGFELAFADSYLTEEQMSLASGADVILAGTSPVSAEMIAASPRLKFIQKWGIGIDKIDLDAAARAGVPVGIAAGSNAGPVAELAVLLMLAVYRRLPLVDSRLRQGVWMKSEMRGVSHQVAGKTIGLLGFGNIAKMVAHRLRGFDVKILYHDLKRADRIVEQIMGVKYAALDDLLAHSDILSLHLPLTPQTRGIICDATIAKMKGGAVLINTARGGLVDEDALLRALQSGKLDGAGLDAFAAEPPEPEHPLFSLGQVALTPHIGGGVIDNVANVARHCFGNMQSVLGGKKLSPEDAVQ
ncbi:MAG: 2-hydroxyacid dehydrogenase [Pusillimonas sp.]